MKVQIGDAMYELEYTVNAVCALEEMQGENINEILASGGFASIRALLWCGLIHNMKVLTLDGAGNIMQSFLQEKSMEDLMKITGDAIEQAGFIRAPGQAPKKQKVLPKKQA